MQYALQQHKIMQYTLQRQTQRKICYIESHFVCSIYRSMTCNIHYYIQKYMNDDHVYSVQYSWQHEMQYIYALYMLYIYALYICDFSAQDLAYNMISKSTGKLACLYSVQHASICMKCSINMLFFSTGYSVHTM